MARAVSIEPRMLGDCYTSSIFLATDDLGLVPHDIEIKLGGVVYSASVCPRKWTKGQVYHRSDLLPGTNSYQHPTTPLTSPNTTRPPKFFDPASLQDDDVMPMGLKALREIFRDFNPSQLPQDLAACLAGDKEAIEANHRMFKDWERLNNAPPRPAMLPHSGPAPLAATPDPGTAPSEPIIATQEATPPNPQPTFQLTALLHASPTYPQTVSRTVSHGVQSDSTRPDLSIQVCSNVNSFQQPDGCRSYWEPHLMFPELHMTTPHATAQTLIANRTNPKNKISRVLQSDTPQALRRITRNKIEKKTNGPVKLDVQAFIDVPLEYSEAQQIL